jgi:hypothetical protein
MRSPSGVDLRGFGQQIQQHLLYLALVGVNHPRAPVDRAPERVSSAWMRA